uniref:lysine--tRNA ligase n=1 Tax=Quercus lobata TaxID=97700 RepID=A0A7N2MV72_QUELO
MFQAASMADSRSKKSAAADDEDMDPTQYFENRLKYVAALRAAGEEPYPHKFDVTMSNPEYVEQYKNIGNGEHLEDVTVNLAGRIMSKRSSSSKLFFYDLHGGGAKVQVMADASKSDLNEEEFFGFHSTMKRGDIVGVKGFPDLVGLELTNSLPTFLLQGKEEVILFPAMKPQDEPSAKGTHFQFGPCYAFVLVDASLFCLFRIQLQFTFCSSFDYYGYVVHVPEYCIF